jgi:hypothetical protein
MPHGQEPHFPTKGIPINLRKTAQQRCQQIQVISPDMYN